MIITRSPLRITLGGGGTDLPPYVREHGGFCLSAAIDKYVYITLHRRFDDRLVVKYSDVENVSDASELKHPLTREAFGLLKMTGKGYEIASHADVPAGTGLGSSGAFTCALLKALWQDAPAETIARAACEVEIDRAGEPVGKQDPYISAFGGIKALTFRPDGHVESCFLHTPPELAGHLLLFYTGTMRRAGPVIQSANGRTPWNQIWAIGMRSATALQDGEFRLFAELLTEQWQIKRTSSPAMTNPQIDGWFNRARLNGALGGKLVGAGGGGFLLFYTEEPDRLRRAMPLPEVRFDWDWDGTKVLVP